MSVIVENTIVSSYTLMLSLMARKLVVTGFLQMRRHTKLYLISIEIRRLDNAELTII